MKVLIGATVFAIALAGATIVAVENPVGSPAELTNPIEPVGDALPTWIGCGIGLDCLRL